MANRRRAGDPSTNLPARKKIILFYLWQVGQTGLAPHTNARKSFGRIELSFLCPIITEADIAQDVERKFPEVNNRAFAESVEGASCYILQVMQVTGDQDKHKQKVNLPRLISANYFISSTFFFPLPI